MDAQLKWRKSVNVISESCMDLNFLKMLRNCGFDGIDLNFARNFFGEDHEKRLEMISFNLQESGLH